MSISRNHLAFVDFIKNEIKTLGVLQGISLISSNFPDLYSKSYTYYYQYLGMMKNIDKLTFKFSCDLVMIIEKKQKTIILEVLVAPEFKIATYVLSICNMDCKTGKLDLIRKFHFDFLANMNPNNKQPIYHMQYGGETTERLGTLKIDVNPLFPWLSSPRLNSIPINLALLLDIVFCEFQNEMTSKISEQKNWRDLIKTNEDIILKKYYQRIGEFLVRDHKSNYLLRDFYYGA